MVFALQSKQLLYAIELAKARNYSQVSEKLNISQPTLSKQIINLEKTLGVKLFERSTASVTLTPAGEYFIREAEALLYREDQILRVMQQYQSGEIGRLSIGVSPYKNLYLMPRVIGKFKLRYPKVQIFLHERTSDQLREEAAEGKYDFVVINLPVDTAVLDTVYLEKEQLLLAVPNAMAAPLRAQMGSSTDAIDFSLCKDLPFVVVAPSQEMRRYFDDLCAACDIVPNISIEVAGGITSAWSMARSGLGATLLPTQFIGDKQFDDSLTFFPLRNVSHTRQPVIVTRRGQYISEYARYAMDLLIECSRT